MANQKVRQHWTELLAQVFPLNSERWWNPESNFDFELRARWIIGVPGSDRPNKSSKTIVVVVTEESESDYLAAPRAEQERYDEVIVEFVREQLNVFDPDHNTPRDQPPPEVRWVIPNFPG